MLSAIFCPAKPIIKPIMINDKNIPRKKDKLTSNSFRLFCPILSVPEYPATAPIMATLQQEVIVPNMPKTNDANNSEIVSPSGLLNTASH